MNVPVLVGSNADEARLGQQAYLYQFTDAEKGKRANLGALSVSARSRPGLRFSSRSWSKSSLRRVSFDPPPPGEGPYFTPVQNKC